MLNLGSGMVVAVPIPKEEESDASQINKAIDQAIIESQFVFPVSLSLFSHNYYLVSEKNISGKEMTPFLLQRINELTGGESLRASTYTFHHASDNLSDIALVLNNAKVGAQIAKELAQIQKVSVSSMPS